MNQIKKENTSSTSVNRRDNDENEAELFVRKNGVEENEGENGEKKRTDEWIGLKEGENESFDVA